MAVLLGRTAATTWQGIVLQLVLIALSYPVMTNFAPAVIAWFLGPSFVEQRSVIFSPLPDIGTVALALAYSLPLIGLNGVLAYIPFRIVARRSQQPLRDFAFRWWRISLFGLLAVPLAVIIARSISSSLEPLPETIFVSITLGAPAWLARRRRLPRWRPVCPECGYNLRRLMSARCPECGEELPSSSPVYRRWAFRRLIWDRRERGSKAIAYIKTMLVLLVCPCRAARGLGLPDRMPRAIRWTAGHLIVLAIIAAGGLATTCVVNNLWYALNLPAGSPSGTPSHARLAFWSAQTFLAWFVAGGTWPLTGILIVTAIPGRHPAARRAGIKWSLYATALPAALVMAIMLVRTAAYLCSISLPGQPFRALYDMLEPNPPHAMAAAILYGAWWARGIAVHPYLRHRGLDTFAVHAILFMAVWYVLFERLINPGGLEWLL